MNADFTEEALTDLQDIWQFYATEVNPRLADRILADIYNAIRRLEEIPTLGHFRSDQTRKPYRFYLVHRFHIIYDGDPTPIYIVRVRHTSRHISEADLP